MELLVKNKICDIELLTPYIGGIMQLFYEQIFYEWTHLPSHPRNSHSSARLECMLFQLSLSNFFSKLNSF